MGVPVGVSLELILPKNRQLWSVNLEALYNSFKPEDKGYDYNLAYLKFNAIVRRYLSTSEIKPFLNVGLSYNIATTAEGILYDGSSSPFNQLNKSGLVYWPERVCVKAVSAPSFKLRALDGHIKRCNGAIVYKLCVLSCNVSFPETTPGDVDALGNHLSGASTSVRFIRPKAFPIRVISRFIPCNFPVCR